MSESTPFDLDRFLQEALDEELEGFEVPDLSEAPKEWMIDKLGTIKDRRKRLEKYEKLLIATLKDLGIEEGDHGNEFSASLSTTITTRLDQEAAKTLLGNLFTEKHLTEDEYKEYFKASKSQTLRITKL